MPEQARRSIAGYTTKRLLITTMKLYVSLILTLFFTYGIVGCQSTSDKPPDPFQWLKDNQIYKTEISTTPTLQFSLEDFQKNLEPSELEDISRGGVLWQKFIVANKPTTLFEKDFVVGAKTHPSADSTFSQWQQNVNCLTIAPEQNSAVALHKVVLTSLLKDNKNSDGTLFYLYESATHTFLGIGFFDSAGKAECSLPNIDVTISTGFGEARQETQLPSDSDAVEVLMNKRSFISIQAGQGKLKEGDLIRIARIKAQKNEENDQLTWREISQRIDDDLYHMIFSPNDNFDANEQLGISFAVTSEQLKIPLELGQYVAIGISTSTNTFCIQKFSVTENSTQNITCDFKAGNLAPLIPAQENRRVLRSSPIQWPANFIKSATFRRWLNLHNVDFFLANTEPAQPEQYKHILVPTAESVFQKFNQEKTNLKLKDFEAINRFEKSDDLLSENKVYFGGSTLKDILKGLTPLSNYTQWYLDQPYEFNIEKNIGVITNGTKIEITDPQISDRKNIEGGTLPHIRGRVTIPAFHRADFLEMYVNNQLFKRLIVPRNSQNSSFADIDFFFDERFDEKKDFVFYMTVWGESFLPEVIYGLQNVKPFAEITPICFDIDNDKKCKIEDIKQE